MGTLWEAGIPREMLFDWKRCLPRQIERMEAATWIHQDLCGKCFAVCPYTERYLRRAQA